MKKSYLFCLITPVLLSFHAIGQSFPGLTERDPSAVTITCPPGSSVICDIAEMPPYIILDEFLAAGGFVGCDNCQIDSASFTFLSEVSDGNTCPETVTRTYGISDMEGNLASCEQLIVVNDDFPPILAAPPANITVSCLTQVPFPIALSWTDNCDGSGEVMGTDMSVGNCPSILTRTWTYTDNCGNTATRAQLITVDDSTPPVITCPPDITIACDQLADTTVTGVATATDDCSVLIDITFADLADTTGCAGTGTIERTWTATDECGNWSTCIQLVTRVDTIPPNISCPPDTAVDHMNQVPPTSNSYNEFVSQGGFAIDNCAIDTASYVETTDEVNIDTLKTVILRTFTITDECGNPSSCQMVITVNETSFGVPEKDEHGIMVNVYPNPFSRETTFRIFLGETSHVFLFVTDILGNPVATILDEMLVRGESQFTWNAEGLPPGIYFYRLTTSNQSATGKMMVVR